MVYFSCKKEGEDVFKTGNDWENLLKDETEKEYFKKLMAFLENEYKTETIYPPKEEIFSALSETSFQNTKAVIIGQDPYHAPSQAHGLSFSVKKGVKLPPSLKNIYKEIYSDLGITEPENCGNLTPWAKEGVLLLNSVLTVREGSPASHKGKGWEIFTDRIIELLNEKEKPIVFLLWGSPAIKKAEKITSPHHLKLTSVHPSPLSAYRGFFGCRHFSKANEFLIKTGQNPINWQLSE